ncbi:MAG TPA: GNAT family N-acetyltransferase [Streptosporangiaceae bacterium]|nr:GNAT family N-acetyltransferase [Streptosporangiaceae bacterium]
MSDRIDVRPARPDLWADVERVLGRGGQVRGCWCMWFRISGSQRRQMSGEGNRLALRELVDGGRTPGLVAYRGPEPAGWCAVAPRQEFGALDRSVVAKPVDDQPVWSLVCLYVVPGNRGQGVARALVRAACEHAAVNGGTIVEAYPVDDATGPVSSDAAYHGVVSLLRAEGFTEVARRTPRRPVMRREVSRAQAGRARPAELAAKREG